MGRLRRVRSGELLTLLGAAVAIVSLFVRSYEARSGVLTAWDTFDAGVVLLILAVLAALALVGSAIAERTTAIPVTIEVATAPLALVAVIATLVRALERPDGATEVCYGAWLALAGAVLILLGAWRAVHDEHGPLYPPAAPEPRPRPRP